MFKTVETPVRPHVVHLKLLRTELERTNCPNLKQHIQRLDRAWKAKPSRAA